MTTGLITFFRHHHYGAQLQAYAAMRAMSQLGHPCQIINYQPSYDAGLNDLFHKNGGLRTQLSNAHTAAHYAPLKRRGQRFDAFVHDYMSLTKQVYSSYDQLCQNPPDFDVYVAGSDQIWSPSIFPGGTFDPAYLLRFAPHGRKISYASSLGGRPFTDSESKVFADALASFHAVSVREESARKIVLNATGHSPTVVLDPTLLLNGSQWKELALKPDFDHPYILCYYISDHAILDPYAQEMSRRTGWPIIQLGMRRKSKGAEKLILDAGPREFLGLFRHASFVCTNSFHGTIFSLHFGRNFYASVSPKEREHPENSRVWSLLSRLGCTERVAGMEHTAPFDAPLDYPSISAKLDAQRAFSLDYLRSAIEGTSPRLPRPEPESSSREWPNLATHESCTGCTACAQICPVDAISMVPDREGFLRPVISDSCILCRKCEKTCPENKPKHEEVQSPKPDCAWAVWNKDDSIRLQSSSGGFFSLLAQKILNQGGAVFGAVYDGDFRGVHHACARNLEELAPMRGSKYVQSDLRDSFRQVKKFLDDGIPVLFTGVACQVSGLYAYLGGDRDNLLTCSLVCNGVPSPKAFAGFAEQIQTSYHANIKYMTFRDKSKGWNSPYFTVAFDRPWEPAPKGLLRFRQKEKPNQWSEKLYNTTYGRGFGVQLDLRPCCGQCPYTSTTRPGDFTLGDFWGLHESAQLPEDREKGVSLVLTSSQKGQTVLEELSPQLERTQRPLEEALAGNPRLSTPLTHNSRRAVFLETLTVQGWPEASKQFLSQPGPAYRLAAKILTPEMKSKLRKFIK